MYYIPIVQNILWLNVHAGDDIWTVFFFFWLNFARSRVYVIAFPKNIHETSRVTIFRKFKLKKKHTYWRTMAVEGIPKTTLRQLSRLAVNTGAMTETGK